MENKKITWGVFLAVAFLAALMLNRPGYADDAGNPYSSQSSENIGAWYDETWSASGFYRLNEQGNSNTYLYEYTATPVTGAVGTFENSPNQNAQVSGGGGGKYTAAGASIPQDLVITEWSVTGHVHFKSGI